LNIQPDSARGLMLLYNCLNFQGSAHRTMAGRPRAVLAVERFAPAWLVMDR
jgi:hypothetical protein